MKKIALLTTLLLTILCFASCNKEKTCQCTATKGQDMIDMGYFTGKASCSEPEKETQGYAEDGWIIKCVEIKVDDNINLNNN